MWYQDGTYEPVKGRRKTHAPVLKARTCRRESDSFIAGFGLYAPTGSYDAGADDNQGMGMWSFEFFGGTTLYFDEAKNWHFAAAAFCETHTTKKDTDIRVGDLLSIEGGFGKSFMEGALSVRLAYYSQWKVTDDDVGRDLKEALGGFKLGKHRTFGLGPDVTVPIATKSKFIASVNARYFWEFGARTTLEGYSFPRGGSGDPRIHKAKVNFLFVLFFASNLGHGQNYSRVF